MKAYCTEDAQRIVNSLSELDAVIEEVHKLPEPTMLFLEHGGGRTLVFGLGAPESVVTYVDESGSSYHSVGDTDRCDVLMFWCRDQLDDFMAEMAVPVSAAIAAAREFYAKKIRPSNLEWEADW